MSLKCDAICGSVGDSGGTQNKSIKPRPHWCPELSQKETRNDSSGS